MTPRRTAVSALLFFALTFPANAQWQRVVFTGKGETTDVPAPHPLSYWTGNVLLRDEGTDLCVGCRTSDGRVLTLADYTAITKVSPLGTLSGYPIVQITAHITGDDDKLFSPSDWKILLVGVGHEEYREIYHLQMWGGSNPPLQSARIVRVDAESVLATYDPDGGNGGGCTDGYWWIDGRGAHALNFDEVYKEIAKKLPANATFATRCWTISMEHQQIKTWAQKADAQCHACGGLGQVVADFTLHGAQAEPTKVEFTPSSE
jgi:hypothetical protein